MRVISLIASATEIVCALGRERDLVGRSHECDFPPSVARLPVCTSPAFAVEGSSLRIDRALKDRLRGGLSAYEVDDELLARLQPDLILTQAQCEVCAVSLKDVEEALARRSAARARVLSLSPSRLDDVFADIRRVGEALGEKHGAEDFALALRRRMRLLAERAERLPKRSVACVEWIEPLMAAGNWTPELVAMAGGTDPLGKPGEHSPWLRPDALRRADPDAIVVAPCGFGLVKTRLEARALERLPGWKELSAVRSGNVFLADGSQFFNRPGPRLAETLEILAEILHPKEFSFGHQGPAWRRYGENRR